jgi:hypothetical protein
MLENTELLPLFPRVKVAGVEPPAPMVTVYPVPEVTDNAVPPTLVLKPPPPPPPPELYPPLPPPATTRYSTDKFSLGVKVPDDEKV